MGYTRQSVAIAFGLLAFKYLLNKQYSRYFFSILFAFLFHKSAIILLAFSPLIILSNYFSKKINFYIYTLLSFLIMTALIYYSSVSGENIYTDTSNDMSSAGAIFRIVVHFLPLGYYFLYKKDIKQVLNDKIVIFDYLSIMIFYI
ncbi:EpsG family protein, partial [Acinetobacter baumannii]